MNSSKVLLLFFLITWLLIKLLDAEYLIQCPNTFMYLSSNKIAITPTFSQILIAFNASMKPITMLNHVKTVPLSNYAQEVGKSCSISNFLKTNHKSSCCPYLDPFLHENLIIMVLDLQKQLMQEVHRVAIVL